MRPDQHDLLARQPNYVPVPQAVPHGPVAWAGVPEDEERTKLPINFRLVFKTFQRYWWQIVLIWAVLAAAGMTLAYIKLEPQYQVLALLQVESQGGIIEEREESRSTIERNIQSHVNQIDKADIIENAQIASPRLAKLSIVRNAEDFVDAARDLIQVAALPQSDIISVSINTSKPNEGATLINAIINEYVNWANERAKQNDKIALEQLIQEKEDLGIRIDERKQELEQAIQGTTMIGVNSISLGGETSTDSLEGLRDINQGPRQKFVELQERAFSYEIEIETLDSLIESLRQRRRLFSEGTGGEEAFVRQIRERFGQLPQVIQIKEQITELQDSIDQARRIGSNERDPSITQPQRKISGLNQKINDLWNQEYTQLAQQQAQDPIMLEIDEELLDAQSKRQIAERLLRKYEKRIDDFEIQLTDEQNDQLDMILASTELTYLQRLAQMIEEKKLDRKTRLDQKQAISISNEARPRGNASNKKRLIAMAGVPVAAFFGVLACFVLLELSSGRVGDPDEVSSRVKVEVLGVVPPLPTMAPGSNVQRSLEQLQEDDGSKRQFHEFMQSLEHLRVLLCVDRQTGRFVHRSLLITSACSGEGKTTLASQLAHRCAEAGMLTLLIDADMRNPSLTRMLDASGKPGLSEVLEGRETPEGATIVVKRGGGFHFLPAGRSGQNPIKLLKDDVLRQLIEQCRQVFDILIIDAPPVLPVPDALLIGRWTDGTAISARYDNSRYPLLKKGLQKLEAIGIPVLGIIVNGCQSRDAYYYSDYYTVRNDDEMIVGQSAES